jgi:hypothetical protein
MAGDLVPIKGASVVQSQNVPALLDQIRPQWQSRNLIERVRRLIDVDPSSACQRIFNAAVHDLREKVIIAGLDIAKEAATQHRLPPIEREESIQNYSTHTLIELSYRMGLLSRAEWRRINRCYDIRRDLEHEDDEYEAGIEDVVYIFNTCIDVILSKDPVQVVKISDFRDLVEQAQASVPDATLIEDFASAPQPRQEEIAKFLLSTALNKEKPDLVQQNAYTALSYIAPNLHQHVKTSLGTHLQNKVGRSLSDRQARVANVSGLMPYVRQSARISFFDGVFDQMKAVGYDWSAYDEHGDLLRSFEEYGGLGACPLEQKWKILWWLVLTFIGKPGGVTQFGNLRKVFYSNTASPIIERIVAKEGASILPLLEDVRKETTVAQKLKDQDIARRFERLVDAVDVT